MESKALAYLEYAKSRPGLVVFADGRRYPASDASHLRRLPVLDGADIVTRHADGPNIAETAHLLVTAGYAKSSYVESDMGNVTEVVGTTVPTLNAWVTGLPVAHPAGRVMRFAPGGEPSALAAILGLIFDPSWYPKIYDHPERNSAIESRLGLTPRWDHGRSKVRAVVTAAWQSQTPPSDADFFTRKYEALLEIGTAPTKAERLIGRYFVKCLLAAWQDPDRPRGAEPMFDVKHLFDARSIDATKTRI